MASTSSRYEQIESDPKGLFTLHVGDEALELLKAIGKIDISHIAALPQRVFKKCRDLGFLRQEGVNFTLDVSETPNPNRDTSMSITALSPPVELSSGKQIARSIMMFCESFEEEFQRIEDAAMDANAYAGVALNEKNVAMLRARILPMLQVKAKTMVSHEMVHIFATDDFSGHFNHLGLDLLELLTDSITLETFYDDYRTAGIERQWFAGSLPYLANLQMAENPNCDPNKILEQMREKAKKTIKTCRARM
ncbi:hypothetical protein WDW86_19125 [Bdellovibrionota bacterium FG-2]